MNSSPITTDELAAMIVREFEDTRRDMATKAELVSIHESLSLIDRRLEQIERRLDHIEDVVLADHLQRIQSIEHAIGLRKRAA